jgi:hypothetical protein
MDWTTGCETETDYWKDSEGNWKAESHFRRRKGKRSASHSHHAKNWGISFYIF